MLLPLVQGTLWTLALSGWRYWNRGAAFSGQSVGARVRRWWWRVNNWEINPLEIPKGAGIGLDGGLKDEKFAEHIGDVGVLGWMAR